MFECTWVCKNMNLFMPLHNMFMMCKYSWVTGNAVGVDGAFVLAVDSLLRVKCLHLTKSRTPTRTQAFITSWLLYKLNADMSSSMGFSVSACLYSDDGTIDLFRKFQKWFYKGKKYQSNQIHLLSSCLCHSVLCLIDCKPAGVFPACVRQMPDLTRE